MGEVGWESFEEINGGSGRNFGWPCYEGVSAGNLAQPEFAPLDFCADLYSSSEIITSPLDSWPHGGTGNAVVLGDFNFGEVFPEEYMGKLFYGDYIQGFLRYADVSDPDNVVVNDFASDMLPMVEMRTGDDGALYYASITTGEIRRIRFDGSDSSGSTSTESAEGGSTDSQGGTTDTGSGGTETASGNGTDATGGTGSIEPTASNAVSVGGVFSPIFTLLGGLLLLVRRRTCRSSRRRIHRCAKVKTDL